MNYRIIGFNLLLAAGLASSFAFAQDPLQHSCHFGLFKRGEAESKDHPLPLPAIQKLEQLVNKNSFKIRDLRDNNQFVYQVYAACPTSGAAALKDLGEDFPADGTTLVAPVDLTGSGVSDLIFARKDWGGWKVLSNGTRLPFPRTPATWWWTTTCWRWWAISWATAPSSWPTPGPGGPRCTWWAATG
jgi:hypothetical protein